MVDCKDGNCGGHIIEDWDENYGDIGDCPLCGKKFQIKLKEIKQEKGKD